MNKLGNWCKSTRTLRIWR